jgi:hypothetical protein
MILLHDSSVGIRDRPVGRDTRVEDVLAVALGCGIVRGIERIFSEPYQNFGRNPAV